ncbi:MAG: hypothetical protein EHM86_00905 [Desulfobulbaceae bacterium]|nr:MAG: hypothetical protein EHM86_00905 [Desulfobulbaceae bacterium]
MNFKKTLTTALLLLLLASSGCAYRHYLGMHGPSINNSPDIHLDAKNDEQCLQCHNPETPTDAPPTNHPRFKGCLKCHGPEAPGYKE